MYKYVDRLYKGIYVLSCTQAGVISLTENERVDLLRYVLCFIKIRYFHVSDVLYDQVRINEGNSHTTCKFTLREMPKVSVALDDVKKICYNSA